MYFLDRTLEKQFWDAHDFTWVNENTILWDGIERTAEKINKYVGKATINTDEVVIAKNSLTSKMGAWETRERKRQKEMCIRDSGNPDHIFNIYTIMHQVGTPPIGW